MKMACLMGTYGRRGFACDALSCFLQQTALEDATLLIYNQHPVEMSFDHPRVRVVNEVVPNIGLRKIKARMVELAGADADFIHWWDDDDLYLPWHIEDCLRNIGDSVAWKPARSWSWNGPSQYVLKRNFFESSVAIRGDFVRNAPLDTHPDYYDHPVNLQIIDQKLLQTTELGDLASYIYRLGTHSAHLSRYVSSKAVDHVRDFEVLRAGLTDPGTAGPLVPSDLWPLWEKFLDGIASVVAPGNLDEIRMRLALAEALSGAGDGT